MPDKNPDVWESFLLFLSMVFAWIGGEAGRVMIAGGAGGFMRWVADEKRKIRDGVFAVCGGAVSGYFLWPLTLAGLNKFTSGALTGPDAQAMAGCLTGVLGMSGVKILVAVFEARAMSIAKGSKDA